MVGLGEIVLQCFYGELVVFKRLDGRQGGSGSGDGGNGRNFVFEGGAANDAIIYLGGFTDRGVDDELDQVVFEGVTDVRTPFVNFECALYRDTGCF